MIIVLLVTLFLQGVFPVSIDTLDEDGGPVVFTNILYRHGERTIRKPWKEDPWGDVKYWPQGLGALTKEGVQHMHQLCVWLGTRYKNLIPFGKQDPNVIYVQSNDKPRRIQSAESCLNGMFQSDHKIPVHVTPLNEDIVLGQEVSCRKFDALYKNFLNSCTYKKLNGKYAELYEHLTKHYNQNVSDLVQINMLNSNLIIEDFYNFTLPEWIRSVFPDKMAEPAGESYKMYTWTSQMKRIKAGPLLKELIENMELKASGRMSPPQRNISMYSISDTNVANLLNTMGIFNTLQPPFASTVMIELRKIEMNYGVTVLFKNVTDPFGPPMLLTPPGCSEICPLTKFREIFNRFLPENWKNECEEEFTGDNELEYDLECVTNSSSVNLSP